MKRIFNVAVLLLLIGTGTTTNKALSQPASVSFSVFYNSLKPYGRWVNNPNYGQIWISNQQGFTPYSTGGHWAYTDYGWTWVSNYDWGWAPFHYGRWAYDPTDGWFWVPGYEWAPAWVAWRGSGDYYGWAPLSPGLNIGVDVSFGNSIPADRWIFAPQRYITSPYINRYYIPRTRNVTIIKNTTVINNVTVKNNVHYVAGPRKEDVEKVNHTPIRTYTVGNAAHPGKTVVNNNTINIYKPIINKDKTVVNNTTVNKNSINTTVKDNTEKSTTGNKNNNNATAKDKPANKKEPPVNNSATPNNQPATKQDAGRKSQQQKIQAGKPEAHDASTGNKPQDNQNIKKENNKNRQVQPRQNVNAGAKQPVHINKPAHQKKVSQQGVKKKNNNQPKNNN